MTSTASRDARCSAIVARYARGGGCPAGYAAAGWRCGSVRLKSAVADQTGTVNLFSTVATATAIVVKSNGRIIAAPARPKKDWPKVPRVRPFIKARGRNFWG